jgi:hypothetical protein
MFQKRRRDRLSVSAKSAPDSPAFEYHRRRYTTPTTPSPTKQEAGSVSNSLTLSNQLDGIANTLTQFREDEETSSQATLTLLKEELCSRREAREQANAELKNISRQLGVLIDLELRVQKGTPSRSQIIPGTPGEDD